MAYSELIKNFEKVRAYSRLSTNCAIFACSHSLRLPHNICQRPRSSLQKIVLCSYEYLPFHQVFLDLPADTGKSDRYVFSDKPTRFAISA